MAIASINPATGELSKRFDSHTDGEIESALDRAVSAFEKYRASSFAERAAKLRHTAEILEKDREHFARIITGDMGKLLRGSIDEIEKCARGCRFYAEHGEKFLSEQIVSSDSGQSYVRYEPLGAVLAIMPWNFPFRQVFRFAAPALMAGNVGLLKHASNVPQCALAIEEVFRQAGFSEGVFQTLLVGSDRSERIIADGRGAAVTLTGSGGAGSGGAKIAGQARKKTVLVLAGGHRLKRAGNFYEPTALCDIPEGSPAEVEEMFGPVASLFRARDMEHAIEIANHSQFGLGSCAWTNDAGERELFIDRVEAG